MANDILYDWKIKIHESFIRNVPKIGPGMNFIHNDNAMISMMPGR